MRSIVIWILMSVMCGSVASGSVEIANLQQDVQALTQQVGRLRLEVEALQQQHSHLNAAMQANKGADGASLRQDWALQLQAQRTELVALINQQIAAVSQQTQAAIDALKANHKKPATGDYPKEGIAYVVKKGDTLSQIALENHSTVKDIQNANAIGDPAKDLRIGQTLFIPQKTPSSSKGSNNR